MTLSQIQREFSRDIVTLKTHMLEKGYEFTDGDAFRDERIHGKYGEKKSYSAANSQHKLRLANDINLFLNDRYLKETEDHHYFGAYWESIRPENRWGGRFNDGNHYERRQHETLV